MSFFMIEKAFFRGNSQVTCSSVSQNRCSVEKTNIRNFVTLHQRALDASARYRKAEAELLEVLDEIDQKRVYLHHQVSSVFAYCTEVLKLSESVSYNLITVMRKSRIVPELKAKSMSGAITLSNARRVAAVITPENKQDWLARAETLSSRQLEKEIARVLPAVAVPERASYVSGSRVRLELGLSEEQMLLLRRVQDQVSQSRQRSVNLEETLGALMEFYLSKKCPVERARRVAVKRGLGGVGGKPGSPSAGLAAERSPATLALPLGAHSDSLARASEVKCDSQVLPEVSARVELGSELTSVETAPVAIEVRETVAAVGLQRAPYDGDYVVAAGTKVSKAPKIPGFLEARALARHEREKIPASVLHAVHLRDGRRCVHEFSPGKICGQMRFTEIHHVIPVASGGANSIENLITLCGAHHRAWHASGGRASAGAG